REGAAEKGGDVAPEPATREVARPRAAAELAALLACIALALLANASLTSMIYGGAWRESVPALLCAGAAAGSLLASLLRWCGAPRAARVALPLLVAAALVAAGTALALTALDARVGPLAAADADLAVQRTVWDEPLASLATVVTTGSEQLAGVFAPDAAETWDLLVVLMGAGLAALLAMLCSSRSLRPAAALVPLGLSAADQAIMGPGANLAWTWASVALGLALVWLSASARPSPARGATVALLAVALGLGASAVAPSGDFSPWSAGETRVETLVDLSQDLRSRSSARALTYETTASGPVYLRIGVLDSFDGATWRFFGDTADALVDASPLSQAALSGDTATGVGAPVTTVVRSADGAAAPPGTATLTSPEEGTWRAVGCYLAPVTSVASVDELPDVRSALARRSYVAEAAPPEDVLAVPGEALPDGVAQVLAAAEAEGVGGGGFLNQLETTRWLVGLFTDGSFSYSLDAPGGDQGNLSAIGEFLQTRSGYCTHYATAFALLSRELGLPARVALGYAPDPTQGEDGNYVVTMLQLHAWAEVWLDGIGWVGVDVTPAAGGAADPAPEPTSPEEEPDETPDAPAEAPTQPEEQTQEDQPAEKDDEAEGSPFPWLVAVLLALALVAVGGVSVLLARRRRVTTWQAAWARVCRKAWRAGVRWDKSATEDQVADLICARLRDEALSAEVRRTCRNACHERYGGQSAPFKQPPLQAIARTLRRGHK
uniref:transglutaminase family protein n=1 Tax=Thermophilibacter sp. TaxID=2847309 RepID=UPI003A9506DE